MASIGDEDWSARRLAGDSSCGERRRAAAVGELVGPIASWVTCSVHPVLACGATKLLAGDGIMFAADMATHNMKPDDAERCGFHVSGECPSSFVAIERDRGSARCRRHRLEQIPAWPSLGGTTPATAWPHSGMLGIMPVWARNFLESLRRMEVPGGRPAGWAADVSSATLRAPCAGSRRFLRRNRKVFVAFD